MIKLTKIHLSIVLVTFLCKAVACYNSGDNEASLINFLKKYPYTKISIDELINSLETGTDDENVKHANNLWYTSGISKRGKRSLNDGLSEEMIEDMVEHPNRFNLESIQGSPWAVFLVADRTKKQSRFLTPRLGRETTENLIDPQRARPPFAPRLGKKSLPFSPRLGRQAFNENDQ